MARFTGDGSDDTFSGTAQRDVIFGNGGYDTLRGFGGSDRIYGGDDQDELLGGDGNDHLEGGADDDYLYGENGNDAMSGDDGSDVLIGGVGNDMLIGGSGDDALRGEAGVDYFDGGDGFDFAALALDTATQGAVADLRNGVVSNDGYGNVETLVSIEGLRGTYYADRLYGNDAANQLSTGVGDIVHGAGGEDTFFVSSLARARLDGGSGSDTLWFLQTRTYADGVGAVVTEQAQTGITVNLATSQVVDDGFGASAKVVGFENVLAGGLNDRLTGDGSANILSGDYGDDVIAGGPGTDTLIGGRGADRLIGGGAGDVFSWGYYAEFFEIGGDTSIDIVQDFSKGDKLDLRPTGAPLEFLGTADFDNARYAIRYEIRDGDTYVFSRTYTPLDQVDLEIKLVGIHNLTADDFINLRTASAFTTAADHSDVSLHVFLATHLGALGDIPVA